MSTEPIICTGDDLVRVCAEIRERGGFVSELETGVGGKNSAYRVSFYQASQNKSQCSSGTTESRTYPATAVKGVVSAARLTRMSAAAGGETRPEKVKSVTDAPASISERVGNETRINFRAGDDPAALVKSPRHVISLPPQPRTDLSREGRPKQECAALGTAIIDRPGGVESASRARRDDLSIDDRMTRIYEKYRASGKVRSRFKSSTKPEDARAPHKN